MPSFKIIEHVVPKEEIVKVLDIYGHSGNLGHLIETIFINQGISYPERLHIEFDFDAQFRFKEKYV